MRSAALLAALTLAACSPALTLPAGAGPADTGADAPATPPLCTPGTQIACACPSGAASVQVCGPTGTYSACGCPDGGSLDAPDVVAADAGNDAADAGNDAAADTGNDVADATDALDAVDAPVDLGAPDTGTDAPVAPSDLGIDVASDVAPDVPVDVTCAAGQVACGGACVDTRTSAEHCGACNALCAPPNGAGVCIAGVCEVGACVSPYRDCDSSGTNGCETNTLTTPAHCGGCGMACAVRPHVVTTCAAGACAYACEAGWGDCDHDIADGCERSLASLTNCGACNAWCSFANAAAACSAAGACTMGSCNAGFADCDGMAANGCEIDLTTNAAHCGACGTSCPTGQTCVAQTCGLPTPGQLLTTRYSFMAATAPDGRAYVWGGAYSNSAEMYDPATNVWTGRTPVPNGAEGGVGVALADGRLLSVGGYVGAPFLGAVTTAAYLYNPATNTWTSAAPSSTPRYYACGARGTNGRVYLFGGRSTSAGFASAESYDPAANTWTAIAAPPTLRIGGVAVTAPDGRIYLLGGSTGTDYVAPTGTAVDIYNPATNTYSAGPALPFARSYPGGALGADGRIYLVGGQPAGATSTNSVLALVPGASTYTTLAPINLSRSWLTVLPLLDGRLLAAGGYVTNRVEAYDPSSNTWR